MSHPRNRSGVAGAGRLKKQVGESGLKSASMRILSLGVFSAKKLHLKHCYSDIHVALPA